MGKFFLEKFSNNVTKQKHEEEEDDQNANTRETVKQTFFTICPLLGNLA